MKLPNGKYRTERGSLMEISGQHGGISRVEFDWLEEDACADCRVDAYPIHDYMVWDCEACGGGRAKLFQGCESEVSE